MKKPDDSDRFVKVRAYLTDEVFGYTHWRAAQFCAPDEGRYAVLIVCHNKDERDALVKKLEEG